MAQRVLMAVLAHPDDESFVMGGTLARYAAEGVAVHLVSATRGEAAPLALAGRYGYPDAASLREAELACAARTLGLADYSFLGYGDSSMRGTRLDPSAASLASADPDEVAEGILQEIHRLQPQAVLTFDATGVYGHPDHIAVHRATLLAFQRASAEEEGPRKLYAALYGRRLLAWEVRLLRLAGRDPGTFGANRDIDLVAALRHAPPPTAAIDVRRYLGVRRRAILCHRSQLAGAPWLLRRYELLPPRLRGIIAGREYFARLHPPPEAGEWEQDLFEGVE